MRISDWSSDVCSSDLLDRQDDGVDAGGDAGGIVALSERRQDLVGDDGVGGSVGQVAFEAIADLDAHLALVVCNDQQHAVVAALLADAPVAAELVATGAACGALQRRPTRHQTGNAPVREKRVKYSWN